MIGLAAVHGVSLDALLLATAEKRRRLGGFTTGIVLIDNGWSDWNTAPLDEG